MRPSFRLLSALALGVALLGLAPAHAADDPLVNQQWGLSQIHAPSAWSISRGDGIKIGIVDSGVNKDHEDIAGKVIASATCVNTNGNMANCTAGGDDINGHGTHVAGIAAANTGNGAGISGVAPGAKIIAVRAFSSGGNGAEPTADLKDVRAGIDWVVSQGAQIVNLSVGVDPGSTICGGLLQPPCTTNPLGPAVQAAWANGALPVIAAGNEQLFGGAAGGYGNLDAIVVGATDREDTLATYSQPIGSAKWGIVAPGGDPVGNTDTSDMIVSSYAGDTCDAAAPQRCYAYLAGTSQAAPHVAGAAAVLFARGLTRQQVVDTLLATADPIDCGSNCSGRLNLARAAGSVASDDTNTPTTRSPNTGSTTKTTVAKGGGTTRTSTTGSATPVSTSTTSPFEFGLERNPPTTFRRPARGAIVLNQTPAAEDGIPVFVGLGGIVSLAGAALAMSYNLRKTLTTLP